MTYILDLLLNLRNLFCLACRLKLRLRVFLVCQSLLDALPGIVGLVSQGEASLERMVFSASRHGDAGGREGEWGWEMHTLRVPRRAM